MKLYSWNINGIRACIARGDFQKFMDYENPDVLCLQETKAERNQVEVDLPDYKEFWNSASKKGYSGTAIFIKNELIVSQKVAQIETPKDKNGILNDKYGDLLQEGRITTLEFKDFYLVTVYTPNSKDDLSRLEIRQKWDTFFLNYITNLEQSKPVLFCGDLNVAHTEIDLANPRQNIGKHGFTLEERAGFEAYLQAGFMDIFRNHHPDVTGAYTWWTHWANSRARNVGWRIDYWMISNKLFAHITKSDIHQQIMGSDHCPISIVLT